jgi:hypothetical protein
MSCGAIALAHWRHEESVSERPSILRVVDELDGDRLKVVSSILQCLDCQAARVWALQDSACAANRFLHGKSAQIAPHLVDMSDAKWRRHLSDDER